MKSINSADASISAWTTVFDWPNIVAAFNFIRYFVAIKSAALSQMLIFSSKGTVSHFIWASVETLIAFFTKS